MTGLVTATRAPTSSTTGLLCRSSLISMPEVYPARTVTERLLWPVAMAPAGRLPAARAAIGSANCKMVIGIWVSQVPIRHHIGIHPRTGAVGKPPKLQMHGQAYY